jgi:Crinkler effector protein N-terminal domain
MPVWCCLCNLTHNATKLWRLKSQLSITMSEIFTLYCWIRGTDIEQHFSVKISSLETVETLKNVLKESQAIDVPASALRLYKPRDPVVEPYHQNLRNVILSKLGKPLIARHKISSLFKAEPPEEHIHIIVGM